MVTYRRLQRFDPRGRSLRILCGAGGLITVVLALPASAPADGSAVNAHFCQPNCLARSPVCQFESMPGPHRYISLTAVTAVNESDIWAVGLSDGYLGGHAVTRHWDG